MTPISEAKKQTFLLEGGDDNARQDVHVDHLVEARIVTPHQQAPEEPRYRVVPRQRVVRVLSQQAAARSLFRI